MKSWLSLHSKTFQNEKTFKNFKLINTNPHDFNLKPCLKIFLFKDPSFQRQAGFFFINDKKEA